MFLSRFKPVLVQLRFSFGPAFSFSQDPINFSPILAQSWSNLGPVLAHFQSSFSPVLVQFWPSFGQDSVQLQSRFSPVPVHFWSSFSPDCLQFWSGLGGGLIWHTFIFFDPGPAKGTGSKGTFVTQSHMTRSQFMIDGLWQGCANMRSGGQVRSASDPFTSTGSTSKKNYMTFQQT